MKKPAGGLQSTVNPPVDPRQSPGGGTIVCTTPLFLQGVEPPTKFPKKEGLTRKEGGNLFEGGLQFLCKK